MQATFDRFPLSPTPGGRLAVARVAHIVDIEPDSEMRRAIAWRLCDIVRHTCVAVEQFYRPTDIADAMNALVPAWPVRPALSPDRREFLFWLVAGLPHEVGIDASTVGYARQGGFEPEDAATTRHPSG